MSAPHKQTVFYIEDNAANVMLVEKVIGRNFPDVRLVSAPSAEAGLMLIYSTLPTVILLDIGLPGMSGYQVVELLRTNNATREIPVVAISAYTTKFDIQRAVVAGFNAYVTKPIDVEHLVRVLGNALQH